MTGSSASPHSLCPYLAVKGAQAAIDFYVEALGATLDFKLVDPSDGRIGHAELLFGTTRLFIADEYPDFGAVGPETLGGSPVKFHLDVADADAFVAHAVQHGATALRAVKLEFYGNRTGLLADPFGYAWFVSSKVEDVSADEMQRRWNATASPALDTGSPS
jgi:PhnB protein